MSSWFTRLVVQASLQLLWDDNSALPFTSALCYYSQHKAESVRLHHLVCLFLSSQFICFHYYGMSYSAAPWQPIVKVLVYTEYTTYDSFHDEVTLPLLNLNWSQRRRKTQEYVDWLVSPWKFCYVACTLIRFFFFSSKSLVSVYDTVVEVAMTHGKKNVGPEERVTFRDTAWDNPQVYVKIRFLWSRRLSAVSCWRIFPVWNRCCHPHWHIKWEKQEFSLLNPDQLLTSGAIAKQLQLKENWK